MKIIPEKWRGTVLPGAVPAWFWLWAHWRDLGAPSGQRPKSAPTSIPAWAWVRYLIHKGYKWADVGEPTPPARVDHARAVLFHGNDVELWLSAPAFYTRALSADRGQPWLTADLVTKARQASNGLVASWCDCRPDGGTDALFAIRAAKDYNLAGWYGQAEDAAQFDHALQRGRENGLMPLAIIGSFGGLRADQIALIASGDVRFIVETYYNVWPWMEGHVDWHNANAGIGGNAVAMYASDTEGATRFPLADQRARGLFNRGVDSIYTPGSLPEDVGAA